MFIIQLWFCNSILFYVKLYFKMQLFSEASANSPIANLNGRHLACTCAGPDLGPHVSRWCPPPQVHLLRLQKPSWASATAKHSSFTCAVSDASAKGSKPLKTTLPFFSNLVEKQSQSQGPINWKRVWLSQINIKLDFSLTVVSRISRGARIYGASCFREPGWGAISGPKVQHGRGHKEK